MLIVEENLTTAKTAQSCLLLTKILQKHQIILQNIYSKFNTGKLGQLHRNNENNHSHLTGQEL